MKKLLFLFSICFILLSCSSDDNSTKEVTKDLFEIPLTNWQLTKKQVLEKESHTLIENNSADDIVILGYPWTDKGDGSLKYSDNDFMEDISYGFFNSNKTLEVVFCIYTKTNIRTTEVVLEFLNSKYGEYTTKTKTPNSSGFAGKVYEFKTTFGIVALEESSSTRNRVIFTKTQYAGKF